jgi:hypothetical protein
MADHRKEMNTRMLAAVEEYNKTMNESIVKLKPKIHQFVSNEIDEIVKNNTVLVKFENRIARLEAWNFTNACINILLSFAGFFFFSRIYIRR